MLRSIDRILCFSFLLLVGAACAEGRGSTIEFEKGETVAIIGNTFAERMNLYGYFETFLYGRYPEHRLVIRNLGWSADEIDLKPRENKVPREDDWLIDLAPDTIIAFFGLNESYRGMEGIPEFERSLEEYLYHLIRSDFNGKGTTRLILVSPIAYEQMSEHIPSAETRNRLLEAYTESMSRVAKQVGVPFIDLFHPTLPLMRESVKSGTPLTINGIHLNRLGYWQVSRILAKAFGYIEPENRGNPSDYRKAEELRERVREKNRQFFYRYRPLNSCYIWGQRKEPFGIHNFPEELKQWEEITAGLDREIWQHRIEPAAIWFEEPEYIEGGYDPYTPAPIVPAHEVEVPSVQETIESFTVADGYEVNLFASEEDFPISSPMGMAFDDRGRLWISNAPTYPHLVPGQEPNDSIIILEDTDRDGKADKHTVFASGLYIPTGFAIGDGGAYVAQQPDLLHFKDSDGDGTADLVKTVLHGFGNADSHHSISAFCWDPGGGFYMHEGVFLYTNVETPWGPFRAHDASVLRYFPKAFRFDVLSHCGYANPWGHVIDRWGQSILNDASNGKNHYFAHHMANSIYPHKNSYGPEFFRPARPSAGVEIISSRHFPEEVQGSFVVNNTIGFHGTFWRGLEDYKSGFKAVKLKDEMIRSTLESFRPVSVSIGPDGALYILDFSNPIIGHMQYSLRDERRDHAHGRVWRITHKTRPLSQQPEIDGQPVPALLDLLNHDEIRVQKFVRRELQERPASEVIPQLEKWLAALDPSSPTYDHSITEALWIYQGLDVFNLPLLEKVLSASDEHARAAGGRVLRYWITLGYLEDPIPLLKQLVEDDSMKVRLEGILACGFVPSSTAADVALLSTLKPLDVWMEHVLKDTLTALKPYGKPQSEIGRAALAAFMSDEELLAQPLDRWIAAEILYRPGLPEEKHRNALKWYRENTGMSRVAAILDLLFKADRHEKEAPYLEQLLLHSPPRELGEEKALLQKHLDRARMGGLRLTLTAALLKQGGAEGLSTLIGRVGEKNFLSAIPLLEPDEPVLAAAAEKVRELLPEPGKLSPGGEDRFRVHRLAMQAGVHIPGIRSAVFEILTALADKASDDRYRKAAMIAMNSLPFGEWPEGFDSYAITARIDREKIAFGKEIYFREQLCATCHQPHGKGMDPAFPPLAGSPWVNGDPERLIKIALYGLQGGVRVNGKDYFSAMAPLGALIDDEEAAAVLTYVRASFGNLAPEITAEQVAAVRAANAGRDTLWTVEELLGDSPSEEEKQTLMVQTSSKQDGRAFVKMWEFSDFEAGFDEGRKKASATRGKEIFTAAGCVDCHAIGGEGNKIGPDLTSVSEKYRGKKLLRQILEPSAEINEDFVSEIIETVDEEMFTGLVVKEDEETVSVLTNPTDPKDLTVIDKLDIVSRRPASLSSMPTGLLIMFQKEEILDLVAFLESGGR